MNIISESIEVQQSLKFIQIDKMQTLQDIKDSNNNDSLNKLDLLKSVGFNESSHFRIYFKDQYIGNIGYTKFHNIHADNFTLCMILNNAGIFKKYIDKVFYISYLEILNTNRNKLINISSIDLLFSLLYKLIDIAKSNGYMYMLAGGKNERLNKFYLRGGFKLNSNYDLYYNNPELKIYFSIKYIRYDLTKEAVEENKNFEKIQYNGFLPIIQKYNVQNKNTDFIKKIVENYYFKK